jgi:hypothetical protein
MDDETSVRTIALAFLEKDTRGPTLHPDCVHLEVRSDGSFVAMLSDETDGGRVVSVLVLKGGLTAVAHIAKDNHQSGFLTLLKTTQGTGTMHWLIISAVVASTVSNTPILPLDVSKVMAACWDEYIGASRVCDGTSMANVFHPLCRLTYSTSTGEVVIKSQQEFCDMVSNRYSSDVHSPFKHLQDDARVKEGDSMMGVDFGTSSLAMVTLKVGHPPFLWTDVLACALLKNEGDDGGGKWWIVAKSSSSEPFLTELAT